MRYSKAVLLVSMGLILLFVSGCASIFSGGPSTLDVSTMPKDVNVTLSAIGKPEVMTKTTPCFFTLNKDSDYKVVLEYQGYKSEEIIIRRTINGWFWGNILIGGLVGMVIDGATQNIWDHNLHVIQLEMQKAQITGELPEKVTVEYPIGFTDENGKTATKYLPITFYRQI